MLHYFIRECIHSQTWQQQILQIKQLQLFLPLELYLLKMLCLILNNEFIIFEGYKFIIGGSSSKTIMFLQKHRYQLPPKKSVILGLPVSSSRIQEVTKRISTNELKGHQNKLNYSDPRKYLIENTQKAIADKQRSPRKPRFSMKSYQDKNDSTMTHFQCSPRKRFDLSKREERIMAARKYREKIWKTSDITNLLRAQQELMQSRRTHNPEIESCQKVSRYKDLLKQFGDQSSSAEKQQLKREWMAFSLKTNNNTSQQTTYLTSNTRNSQLQVTNLEFMEGDQAMRSPIKLLINREREKRREIMRRSSHISYSSCSKRPNTTGNTFNQNQDNFIEPW